MTWITGTADNYLDLLTDIATIVSANSGHVLEQTSDLLYFYFEGDSGADKIYCGIQGYADATNSRYNYRLYGSASWRSGKAAGSQPLTSGTDKSVVYLWNSSIPYWLSINKRRLVVSIKISTVYQQFYLGLLDTSDMAIDKQYPYPLFVGGSSATIAANYSTSSQVAFWNNQSNISSGRLMLPGGRWGDIRAQTQTAYVPNVKVASKSSGFKTNIITALDGATHKVDQMYAMDYSTTNIYGALDGMFRISGYNNSSENIVTVDGENYMVFQDTSKTSLSDYCCIKME